MKNKIALAVLIACMVFNGSVINAAPYAGVMNELHGSTTPTAGISAQLNCIMVKASYDVSVSTNQCQEASVTAKDENVQPSYKHYNVALSDELQDYTHTMCERYGIVDYYDLILKQMYVESGYVSGLVSATNDYGLMQVNICNHRSLAKLLGITDFLDDKQSIEAGVYIMSIYLTEYNDASAALMCYNLGDASAQRCWSKGIYSTDYSNKILSTNLEED